MDDGWVGELMDGWMSGCMQAGWQVEWADVIVNIIQLQPPVQRATPVKGKCSSLILSLSSYLILVTQPTHFLLQ